MPRARWKPTPQQLMFLQGLYRKGLTNPNSCQVQTITAHLSLCGKIQWKNVFYWFQNHKARDRQKMRKQIYQLMQKYTTAADENLHSLPPCAALNHQLYPNSPTIFVRQVEGTDASPQMMKCLWENCIITDEDSSNMVQCRKRPLKTLELFPVATTGFKD